MHKLCRKNDVFHSSTHSLLHSWALYTMENLCEIAFAQQFRLKLLFLFLIFQVSPSFISRTSLVIQLTPGHARKARVTLALQQQTMTTKTATEIRAAQNCSQSKNLMKLFEHLNEASTVLWPHCVLLVTLVKNL